MNDSRISAREKYLRKRIAELEGDFNDMCEIRDHWKTLCEQREATSSGWSDCCLLHHYAVKQSFVMQQLNEH